MTMRSLVAAIAVSAVGVALASTLAHADSPPPRIGVLIPGVGASPLEEELREGLRELGYVEGKNIIVDWRRSTTGAEEDLRLLATDLAGSRADLIVASGSTAARAALTVTTLPVVFAPVGDPVETGLATSLSNPEGHGTGVSIVSSELIAKRLEFLRALVPQARRIVFLRNSSNPAGARVLEAAKEAAQTLRVRLVTLDARDTDELSRALRAIPRTGADGVVVTGDFFFLANKAKIAEAIRQAKLPAIFPTKEYHDPGVLMSYGPNLKEAMRRVAVYVDKVLKGAKPSALPIEQVSKFDLIIDLRVARALKLNVPQALLLRADEVIQ